MELFIVFVISMVIIAWVRIQSTAPKSKRTGNKNRTREEEAGGYMWFPGDSGESSDGGDGFDGGNSDGGGGDSSSF